MFQRRQTLDIQPLTDSFEMIISVDFEEILEKCGDFGRYQWLLLLLFGILNMFAGMHYFTQSVISWVPEHWCYHEYLENKTFVEIKEIYRHFNDPSCTKLDFDKDGNSIQSNELCTKWIYNYDYGFRSMNTELNWVCHNAFNSSVGQSFFFLGSFVGTLLFGYLADRIGRVLALIISNLSGFLGEFLTTYCEDVWYFSISRFISGLAADSNVFLFYIIVLEYLRPNLRTVSLNLCIGSFYCIGLVFVPWIAILSRNWQTFLKITSSPLLMVLSFYFIIQESAQWLVTRNRVEDAIKRLKYIARFNGNVIKKNDFNKFALFCEHEKLKTAIERPIFFDVFRTPRLRKMTFVLFYISIVISFCFDTVARDVENTGFSPFVAFSLAAAVIFPAGVTLILIQTHVGRKGMTVTSLIFGGLLCTMEAIVLCLTQHREQIILLCLVMLGRFAVSIAYESGSQYAIELIPTSVRGFGVATIHVIGFASSFLVPYVLYLGKFFPIAPSIILALIFFSGAFACLFLPETLNKPLPKTLDDGEKFGIHEKICSFYCWENEKRSSL